MYGSYDDRKLLGIFKVEDPIHNDKVILEVDLNLTMNKCRHDSLQYFFTHMFKDLDLCDVEPIHLVST